MDDSLFPSIKKTIDSFIQDEEGSIPHGKLITLGAFFMIMSSYLVAAADHSSHRSHQSHRSHSSHSSGSHGSHSNHGSHSSHSNNPHNSHYSHASHSSGYATAVPHSNHGSHSNYVPHSSHGSHTSHSNTISHSNSQFSEAGDLSSYIAAPAASAIKGIDKFFEFADNLPDVDSAVASVVVENPNLGSIKASVAPKTLMDVPKPDIQIPNDSLSIPAITPTLQNVPGPKDINPSEKGIEL